jgi:hypothetical protein
MSAVRANMAVPKSLLEAALYAPLEALINGFFETEGLQARAVAQARTEFGIPDFVVDEGGILGYIEAKRPGTRLDALAGRDRRGGRDGPPRHPHARPGA